MSVAYPLRLFLDCSTAHLSPIARTYLDAGDGIASTTSYGWFVYASEEPDDAVPADLAFLMAHAQTLGAEYINFDCDALEIDDLPTFDWSGRSEEHTSELQSLMRISYAVLCLKKKK